MKRRGLKVLGLGLGDYGFGCRVLHLGIKGLGCGCWDFAGFNL